MSGRSGIWALVLAGWMAAGLAQDAPETILLDADAAPQDAAADSPGTDSAPRAVVEEIVVTATKQDRLLRDIPASIAVIDGEQLDRIAAQEMEEFLRLVPGVNLISQDVGATKVTVRGISSELGTAPTTGILYGNVSFSDAFFPFVSLDPHPFDMHDVEVLKGPQGTLFGASALNGAVRYVPKPAEPGQFEARYFAQLRRLRHGETVPVSGGALNLPLGDEAGLRVVAVGRDRAGFTDDTGRDLEDVNRGRQLAGRALARWEPGERWRVSAAYVRQDTDYEDEAFADNREGRLERSNTPVASPRSSDYEFLNLSLEHDLPWATLVSETAFVRKRFYQETDISRTFTGSDTTQATVGTFIFFDSDTFSQELRISSRPGETGPWSFVGGLFWSDQPIESGYDIFSSETLGAGTITGPLAGIGLASVGGVALVSENGEPLLGRQRSDIAVTEKAVFGELSRQFGVAWEAALGLRLYETKSGGVAVAEGALYGGSPNVNEDQITENGLNPKLSLSWRPTDWLMVYAQAARGFRVGGIQPTASSLSPDIPRVFRSDTIRSYELGVRSSWFDRSLLVDATVYRADWDDALLSQLDPNNPNPVAYYYDNVAGARSRGVETAIEWRPPVAGLSLSLSAAYNRTTTSEPFTVASGEEIPPGTAWPFAPRWQSVAALRYERPIVGAWGLRAGLSHSRSSRAWTTLLNDVGVYGYPLLDAQLSLINANERWPELTLAVTNLADRRGINQDTVLGSEPIHDVMYTAPRTLSLMLSGRF